MGLRDFFGDVSDAIPNEFSKLNAFSQFLPPPFNLLVQAPAAVDRFGETYSNGAGLIDSGVYGAQAFAGQGGDPNKYTDGGGENWVDTVGGIGNLASMFGGMGGMGGSNGQASGFSGVPNLEFADGSGRYLEGNAPYGGSFVDGKFLGDIGGMFGDGSGQPQMPNFLSPEELQRQNSMQSFDWSNILKMLGSSGLGAMGGEQPQGGISMLPRTPSFIAPIQTSPVRGEGYYQTWLQKNNLV